MKFLIILSLVYLILFGGESEIVKSAEKVAINTSYKELAYEMFLIKKMKEELVFHETDIVKIQQENALLQKRVNFYMDKLSEVPVIQAKYLSLQSTLINTEVELQQIVAGTYRAITDEIKTIEGEEEE